MNHEIRSLHKMLRVVRRIETEMEDTAPGSRFPLMSRFVRLAKLRRVQAEACWRAAEIVGDDGLAMVAEALKGKEVAPCSR